MFNNIGGKIKTLAKILCWLGIIISVVSGVLFMAAGDVPMVINGSGYYANGVVIGIVTMVFGCLASWIGSFFAYGFGQLIENSDIIRKNIERKD